MTSVYAETSVPSAHVTTRQDAGSLYRRGVTRAWWARWAMQYDLYISNAVILELNAGEWPGKEEALELVRGVPGLDITDEVESVARRYMAERLVPGEAGADAVHLAVACVHSMDYLLTWNIRHLANPNKFEHLVVVNRRLGLMTPAIVTPEGLWPGR